MHDEYSVIDVTKTWRFRDERDSIENAFLKKDDLTAATKLFIDRLLEE